MIFKGLESGGGDKAPPLWSFHKHSKTSRPDETRKRSGNGFTKANMSFYSKKIDLSERLQLPL